MSSPKIHTDLLWDLTLLFVVLASLYFSFIFIFKKRFSIRFHNKKNKRAELAPIISNFLFHSPEDPKAEQKEYVELKIQIREFLTEKRFRKILADILFDLQKDVAGGTKERLYNLYVELGLHHDAYSKLSSWRWNTVAQGILELSQMKVPDSFQLLSKFINDKRGVVRKQAEIAIVSLQNNGIDHLLDSTKYAISEWQQLKLIEALGTNQNYIPPKFKSWLVSFNKDVVLFALRLIRHFNQNEASPSIAELVKHKNDEIKIAAISCIKDFNFKDANGTLKKVFWKCSDAVKLQILEALKEIGDHGDLMFLEEVGKMEKSFAVISKAYAAINTIEPDSVLPTKDIVQDLEIPIIQGKSGLEDADFLEMEVVYVEVPYELIPKAIEVEEIEVYNLVAQDEDVNPLATDKEENLTEPVLEVEEQQKNQEIVEVAFELGEMEVALDQATNDSLGLLRFDSSSYDEFEFSAFQDGYVNMSITERNAFFDTLECSGGDREAQLLEFIMENEEDAELRFRAFDIMKRIDKDQIDNVVVFCEEDHSKVVSEDLPEVPEILPEHSIFYELYQYASDQNSKEILIKEMMLIGDERELPFLHKLLETENDTIKTLAQKAIVCIQEIDVKAENNDLTNEKVNEGSDMQVSNSISEINFDAFQGLLDESVKESINEEQTNDTRIPLELCFLYDELGILYDKENTKNDLDLNFELSDEFYMMAKVHKSNQER